MSYRTLGCDPRRRCARLLARRAPARARSSTSASCSCSATLLRGSSPSRAGLKGGGHRQGDRRQKLKETISIGRQGEGVALKLGAGRRLGTWRPVPRPPQPHRPDRRLRLRRRRAHRAARAARALPHEDFVYLGRHARASPTASARAGELERFALRDRRGAARARAPSCSSSRATRRRRRALPALQSTAAGATLGVDVIGVVGPEAVLAVARDAQRARSGCSPRRRRSASGAYERAVGAADPHVASTASPCPDLAPDHPAGRRRSTERDVETVRGYCAPLREAGVDTVILGCTHYPLVRPLLQRMLGPRGDARHLRAPRSPAGSSTRSAARELGTPRDGRGRLPLPVHRRPRGVPRARHALPAAAARRRSSTSTLDRRRMTAR